MFWLDRKTIIEITTMLPATCSDDAGLMVTFMLILLWYFSLKASYIADLLDNFPTVSPLSFVSINFAQRMLVWVERHGPGTHTHTHTHEEGGGCFMSWSTAIYQDMHMRWWSDEFQMSFSNGKLGKHEPDEDTVAYARGGWIPNKNDVDKRWDSQTNLLVGKCCIWHTLPPVLVPLLSFIPQS